MVSPVRGGSPPASIRFPDRIDRLLSIGAVILLAMAVAGTARHHDVVRHRRAVHGMVIGALLVAGFFTFPFHRLLGTWLFG